MENHHLEWTFPLKIVIFHSYDQRVTCLCVSLEREFTLYTSHLFWIFKYLSSGGPLMTESWSLDDFFRALLRALEVSVTLGFHHLSSWFFHISGFTCHPLVTRSARILWPGGPGMVPSCWIWSRWGVLAFFKKPLFYYFLVGGDWNMTGLFFNILGIIILIDLHIFQRGGSTTNQSLLIFIVSNHDLHGITDRL